MIRFVSLILAACLATVFATQAVRASDCQVVAEIERLVGSKGSIDGATCNRFNAQNGKTGVSCFWEFPFRDHSATEAADRVWDMVQFCRTGTNLGPDSLVNHPDSYDLRTWDGDAATYQVSIKDKGGLQKTLVFLRIER